MPIKFLLNKVIINGVLASPEDKFEFYYGHKAGKVQIKNVIDWNGCIDIETY